MKDFRYAHRGTTFEEFIKWANKRYQAAGDAVICKIPTEILPIRDGRGRIVSAKICEKSTVDFIGKVGNRPIAIEAKHTSTDSIRWDAVQDHQSSFLSDFYTDVDTIAIVLVSFNLERFYAVPWDCWKLGRDAWKEAQMKNQKKAVVWEYINKDKETIWTTNGKASLKASDLLPEWEVFMDNRVGLNYLAKYLNRKNTEKILTK